MTVSQSKTASENTEISLKKKKKSFSHFSDTGPHTLQFPERFFLKR